MWKAQYDGKEVAVKILRVYLTSNFEKIRKVGCSRRVRVDELTVSPYRGFAGRS